MNQQQQHVNDDHSLVVNAGSVAENDDEYEEVEEVEDIEELVVFRIPALLGASSTNMCLSSTSLSGFNTPNPSLTFSNGYGFKGVWSDIPHNAAVIGLKRLVGNSSAYHRDDSSQQRQQHQKEEGANSFGASSVSPSEQHDDGNKNPQSLDEVRQRMLVAQKVQDSSNSSKRSAPVFAPTLTERLRPLHAESEDDGKRSSFILNGVGMPTRMITFAPSAQHMMEFAGAQYRKEQKRKEQHQQHHQQQQSQPPQQNLNQN